MDTYIVRRLDQAKLLTDPFKLKLLEQFGSDPVTTKQVADQMGEKAPRLYRHVDALHDAGLLELVEEKPKRGTVERYFRTIASRFEVDPGLFATSPGHDNDAIDMMRSLIRETESELVSLYARLDGYPADRDQRPLLMRVSVSGTDDEIRRLKEKLNEWLEACDTVGQDGKTAGKETTYSGLVAFYPRPDVEAGDGE